MRIHRTDHGSSLARCAALLVLLTLPACSKDSTAPTNPGGGSASSTFVGTMVGATVGGKLTVVVPTTAPVPQAGPYSAQAAITATGTFAPSGASAIALTGTYDASTKALSVSGGGYTLTGTYFSGVLRGTWVRTPSGSGSFVLVLASSATSVRAYCGTYTSTSGGSSGIFNFVIQGTTIDGIACSSSGTETRLQGTLAGGTGITLINPLDPGPFLATGTLNGSSNTVSGTYDDGAGNNGTWSGVGC